MSNESTNHDEIDDIHHTKLQVHYDTTPAIRIGNRVYEVTTSIGKFTKQCLNDICMNKSNFSCGTIILYEITNLDV